MTCFKGLLMASFALAATGLSAQRNEIGVQLGASNLVGDIGRTNFILQRPFGGKLRVVGIPFYGGISYHKNFNPYQSLRFDLGYSNVQFSDLRAKEFYRQNRNAALPVRNSVVEADAIFQYYFLPVNNEQRGMLSPYIFGGIGGIAFDNYRTKLDVISRAPHSEFFKDFAFSMPFGAGLKYKFNYRWAVSGELKFRYNFTDGIDFSNAEAKNVHLVKQDANGKQVSVKKTEITSADRQLKDNFIKQNTYGNPNSNDWVNSITLGVSYAFGRPPCYCEQ